MKRGGAKVKNLIGNWHVLDDFYISNFLVAIVYL